MHLVSFDLGSDRNYGADLHLISLLVSTRELFTSLNESIVITQNTAAVYSTNISAIGTVKAVFTKLVVFKLLSTVSL